MSDTALCIGFALLATSLSNLGMGVQKAGIGWMENGLKPLRHLTEFLVWVGGIVMCIVAPFCLGKALTLGDAATVGALGAFGLIPLYLFSGLVLKEPITRPHYLALVAISAGVAFIGFNDRGHHESSQSALHTTELAIGVGASLLLPALAAAVCWKLARHAVGLGLGCLAGSFAGIALLALKVGAILDNWWISGFCWILVSIFNFLILQFAYQQGSAVQVVPASTSFALMVPVAVSPSAFGEPMNSAILIGMAAILVGVGFIWQGERLLHQQIGGHAERDIRPEDETGGPLRVESSPVPEETRTA